MPYSEKQIAEWAVKVADEYTDNADYTGPLAPLLESKVRTLIAAVRKETREECARVCKDVQHNFTGGAPDWQGGCIACAAAIRNLQEREEGKR